MMLDPQKILQDAPVADSFFEGFQERRVPLPEGHVFCRIKGEGPPLLLLHGYPQTSAIWHKVAPRLSQDYQVICADLRGYGRSAKPQTDAAHAPYTKRAMAGDLLALMDHLGHQRFLIGAHDRGARVAHRLAADQPDRVLGLSTLDIAPTREMYRDGDTAFAADYWHWYWLIQAAPFPERLISADPDYFWIKKCCSGASGARPFMRQALEEYLAAFRDPQTIHGACEDYRAAFTLDLKHDAADPGPITMPLLALWGAQGAIERHFDCLTLWKERANRVSGHSLPCGHYIPEDVPERLLQAWLPFFSDVMTGKISA